MANSAKERTLLSIGDTAQKTSLSVDTLRYYEKIGLLPRIARDSGGRRRYDGDDLSRLRFIQRAQRCDFSLDEIRQLLEFRGCRDAGRPAVAQLTEHKLADIQHRLADLEQLQNELQQLLHLCQGSDQGCPIIEGLDRSTSNGARALK
jgi:DNA-binding transcriptional MerR regulator